MDGPKDERRSLAYPYHGRWEGGVGGGGESRSSLVKFRGLKGGSLTDGRTEAFTISPSLNSYALKAMT